MEFEFEEVVSEYENRLAAVVKSQQDIIWRL
jgi:hypothetical protein